MHILSYFSNFVFFLQTDVSESKSGNKKALEVAYQLLNKSGININGIYALNEERLKTISDKRFLELRDKQFLGPIYAHLVSLGRFERLIQKKNQLANEQSDQKSLSTVKKKNKIPNA